MGFAKLPALSCRQSTGHQRGGFHGIVVQEKNRNRRTCVRSRAASRDAAPPVGKDRGGRASCRSPSACATLPRILPDSREGRRNPSRQFLPRNPRSRSGAVQGVRPRSPSAICFGRFRPRPRSGLCTRTRSGRHFGACSPCPDSRICGFCSAASCRSDSRLCSDRHFGACASKSGSCLCGSCSASSCRSGSRPRSPCACGSPPCRLEARRRAQARSRAEAGTCKTRNSDR